jgi:hypothetical protein
MLTSLQAMVVWWAEELINLDNDAHKAIFEKKLPDALGQHAAVVWQEIWNKLS